MVIHDDVPKHVVSPFVECIGDGTLVSEPLVKSSTFPWACPACFKKGVAAVQRAVLKPTGQRAAGAKAKRKRGGRK